MKKLSAVLFSSVVPLIVVSSLVAAEPELKGSPNELRQFLQPEAKTVTIFGEAEQRAYSDTAVASLVITTEEKTLSGAISANTDLRQVIAQRLTGAGVEADAINSSKFSTSPQYGWFGRKPASYKVVNRMAVKISSEAHLQAIASAADADSQVELSDITFEHSTKDAVMAQVKQQALDHVLQQEQFYEDSLGVKLIPISFRDASVDQRPTQGAEVLEEVIVTRMKSVGDSSDSYSDTRSPSFDEIEYSARISVDFRVQPSDGDNQRAH